MPLQGLSLKYKLELLQKVANEEMSLKELQDKASNLKHKLAVVDAFLQFTGEASWEELREKYPHHTTESQIAQFKHLRIKRKTIPEVNMVYRFPSLCIAVSTPPPTGKSERERLCHGVLSRVPGHQFATNYLHAEETELFEEMLINGGFKTLILQSFTAVFNIL